MWQAYFLVCGFKFSLSNHNGFIMSRPKIPEWLGKYSRGEGVMVTTTNQKGWVRVGEVEQ